MTVALHPIGTEAERMTTYPERYHVWQQDPRQLAEAAYRVEMYPEAYPEARREAILDGFNDWLDANPGTVAVGCSACRTNVLYADCHDVDAWDYVLAYHGRHHAGGHR